MFQYVALTDGTTTVEFTDNISYALVGYGPVVAPLRDNELGGEGPYETVADAITFHAMGCTAAEAYAAAATVNRLLDQARRWWLIGENVSPVVLKIQAQDSDLSPLQTIIKGRAPGGASNMVLQPVWSQFYNKYAIQNITIQFLRRGRWLLPSQDSATSGSLTKPDVQTCTFSSSAADFSPLTLEISGFIASSADMRQGWNMLLWAPAASDFTFLEGEAINPGGEFSVVVEATARGGNILRAALSGTAPAGTDETVSAGIPATQQRVDVYVMLRNNDTTRTYSIRARMFPLHSGSSSDILNGPWVPVDGSTTWARPIALGSFVSLSGWDVCFLEITPSAGSGTLDIDYLLFQCRDKPLASGATGITVFSTPDYPGAYILAMDDKSLTWPVPTLSDRATGQTDKYLSYQGDIAASQIGSTVAVVWMSTSGTKFGQRNNADSGYVTTTITARRRLAYLVPQ